MATRAEVYAAIDSERAYQDHRWGVGSSHEIAAWILYMSDYLHEAACLASRDLPGAPTLDVLRKVVALGVACMEQHGAPQREGFEAPVKDADPFTLDLSKNDRGLRIVTFRDLVSGDTQIRADIALSPEEVAKFVARGLVALSAKDERALAYLMKGRRP